MSSDSEISDGSISSDNNDEEWEVVESVIMETFHDYEKRHLSPQPYRNDPFGGRDYVNRVLTGNDNRCPDMFRMKKAVLFDLADTLKTREISEEVREDVGEEVRDGSNQASTSGSIEQRRREMGALRDEICKSMAMYYRLPM
ncbi:hypothetical protein FRX31_022142 [Thalictrum thalictroides]|uniref:DUF8040 domain-containing protein n=1 Tax=Thalictrum thalictroides TaxID=46969 RepID=A0A7J6VUK2_THATH|nr:hypothetical protein FRX31_022142 [Thalictrum thalictroides]